MRERPFTLTPNPRFIFLSTRQREALSSLRYGLSTPHGFMLLTGEPGSGKTTMLHAALAEFDESRIRCVILTNPTLSRGEFYEWLARAFRLSDDAAASKARFLTELRGELEERFRQGVFSGLIIDEAQSLPDELLEEIRLLGNLETPTAKLLNIVLAGQTELLERLDQPGAQALKQRMSLRCELRRFDRSETAAYIAGRLRIAGGRPQDIFTQEAVVAVYEATSGLPRTINVICDNALVGGFAEQARPVPARLVQQVASEFDLGSNEPLPPPDPAARPVAIPPMSSSEPAPKGFFGAAARVKRRFSFFS